MATERVTGFTMHERYHYDFNTLTYARGWAQMDTRGDASYYGNWVNPERRELFSYCEGDTTLTHCDSDDEFVAELRRAADWHKENQTWLGIDPGLRPELREKLTTLGVADLLH
jgi:hypothetical protein